MIHKGITLQILVFMRTISYNNWSGVTRDAALPGFCVSYLVKNTLTLWCYNYQG